MNQKSARKAILEEWESLPENRRRNEDQAMAFILNLMNRRPELFQFKYRQNPVEKILCWLLPDQRPGCTPPLEGSHLSNDRL
jgi:hypothetical protein